jgi:predicted DNA-binding transcriptional regulator AlpA
MSQSDELLPDPKVCKRYDVVPMTIWRWERDKALNFPKAIRIRGRKYRRLRELEAWERQRARAGRAA